MPRKKNNEIDTKGWKETTVQEFLNLSDTQMEEIDKRIKEEKNPKNE